MAQDPRLAKVKADQEQDSEEFGEEYELMSHREILELRDELKRLKVHPNEKTLQLSMVELAAKVDKLSDIFTEAMHEIRIEEGGLTFQDKMKPLVQRMDKILEQNSQIAEGVVAIADLVTELKDMLGGGPSNPLPHVNQPAFPPAPGGPAPFPGASSNPPGGSSNPQGGPAAIPPLPPPPR